MSGIKGLLNLCFIPHPLLQNHQRIPLSIVLMLVSLNLCWNACYDEKKIKFVRFCWLSKCWTKTELSECFHARSWLMFCDVRVCYRLMAVVIKPMHTTSRHNILLESLLSDVWMCLNGSGLWRTHKLLMLWLLILRILVFAALSAALLIIKWMSLTCKMFLNDQSWKCENLNEMCSYIWNGQK